MEKKADFKGHDFCPHTSLDWGVMTGYANSYVCSRCGHGLTVSKQGPDQPLVWSQTEFDPCPGFNTKHDWIYAEKKSGDGQPSGKWGTVCSRCGISPHKAPDLCAVPTEFKPPVSAPQEHP